MSIKEYPTLYKKASTGKTVIWWMELNQETGAYRTCSGQKGGKVKEIAWTMPKPKNVGKANETCTVEQGVSEVEAKYEKQLKSQYFWDEADINRVLFFQVMLAEKFMDRFEDIVYPVRVQRKFNGTRCAIHGDGNAWETGAGAYSRKGEQYFCVEHILEETNDIIKRFPKALLDGEMFKHGVPLNEITSLVSVNRKAKDVTPEDLKRAREIIEFHIYDGFGFKGVNQCDPFSVRHEALQKILSGYKYLKPVETFTANNYDEVIALLERFIAEGYEGAIIRTEEEYENKRSNNLLKLKKFIDAEFEVVDIIASEKGDWAGKAKRIVIKLPNGETSESNIKGKMEDLEKLYKERHKHIGKLCTVKFQEYSPNGVPLIPYTELPFRDYE